ncbi:MAG: hypothetical protein V4558_13270 [Gemmatimonadota bacterium]
MPDPQLPPLSHLQFLVLGVLLTEDQPGRAVRDAVAEYGVRRSGAAFYQLMARLERDGVVEGWYASLQVGDQSVMERRYRITARGRRAWNATRAFNDAVAARHRREELSDA